MKKSQNSRVIVYFKKKEKEQKLRQDDSEDWGRGQGQESLLNIKLSPFNCEIVNV